MVTPELREQIERWRDQLLDRGIVIDDARAALERAIEALREAVREYQRDANHLAHLFAMALDEAADPKNRKPQ